MIAIVLAPCLSAVLFVPVAPMQAPPPLDGSSTEPAGGLEPVRWPLSERALLGAVLVGEGERRLASVRDALVDGLTGEVLHLAIAPRAAGGSAVRLGRHEVQWHFEQQRFATHLGSAELARLPAADSALQSSLPVAFEPRAAALEAASPLDAWGASALSLPAHRAWSLAALTESELVAGRKPQRVTGLVLDADARRVLAVVIARGDQELALPPAALGLAADGRLFLREGSRALKTAPSRPGPALDALADPEFRALWEAHWAVPVAAGGA